MTNKNEYISKKLKDDEYIENLTTKTIKISMTSNK
jgi:hypothetical protein